MAYGRRFHRRGRVASYARVARRVAVPQSKDLAVPDFSLSLGHVRVFRLNEWPAAILDLENSTQGPDADKDIYSKMLAGSFLFNRATFTEIYYRQVIVYAKGGIPYQSGDYSMDSKQPANAHDPRIINPQTLFRDYTAAAHPGQLHVNVDLFKVVTDKRFKMNATSQAQTHEQTKLTPFTWRYHPHKFRSMMPGIIPAQGEVGLHLHSKTEYYMCMMAWAPVPGNTAVLQVHPHLLLYWRMTMDPWAMAGGPPHTDFVRPGLKRQAAFLYDFDDDSTAETVAAPHILAQQQLQTPQQQNRMEEL